jgi:glycerophosphoryl diester phosphodiesterase
METSGPGAGPIVIAHRGGSGLAPENTLAAFENAAALGVDGIECDVRLLADGRAAVIHDPTLERTTDGVGPIADLTEGDLARIDAGFRFHPEAGFPLRGQGYRIPLLRDVLAVSGGLQVLIELKTADEALARVVTDDIESAGAADRVLVGSFHQDALECMRALAPRVRRGANRAEILAGLAGVIGQAPLPFHSFQVPETFEGARVVSESFIARAHAAGARVIVWTVDREDDMLRLLSWGVDGLITDRPDIAVPVVRRWRDARLRHQ